MSIHRFGVGPRMSAAVVHGHTIYLAGQVADKAAGGTVGEQTQEILGIVDKLLAAAWEAWVAKGHTPARATVEAKLAAPKYTVEIVCIAAKP
jgi:enamine deaminase RidA (YjgF/YER057c/UK114 family)